MAGKGNPPWLTFLRAGTAACPYCKTANDAKEEHTEPRSVNDYSGLGIEERETL
jgi:hypothetical protein